MRSFSGTLVVGTTLVLVILAAFALPGFAIEPDLAKMLPEDHPHVRLASLLDARAENRRSLFVVLRGEVDEARLNDLVADLRRSQLVS